jgi:hypothetical protein
MAINRSFLLLGLASAALLAACAEGPPAIGPADKTFGAAVRHNIEVQTVNPAAKPEAGPIPYDGERGALAMERYQSDKVKQPRSMRTRSSAGTGTGGGSN